MVGVDRPRDRHRAARICGVNLLAQKPPATATSTGWSAWSSWAAVQAGPEFFAIPRWSTLSDVMVEAFGDAGRHARSAVGVYRLPLNFAVEVDAVVQVR